MAQGNNHTAYGMGAPNMLVYQYDADIFPRLCEIFESGFDLLRLRLVVNDQKIPPPFGTRCHMLLLLVSIIVSK